MSDEIQGLLLKANDLLAPRIYVYADKAIYDAFASHSNAQFSFAPDMFNPRDAASIWVFAHAATKLGEIGSNYPGLRWLQSILSDPEMNPRIPMLVMGFLDRAQYGDYAYLLADNSAIKYVMLPRSMEAIIAESAAIFVDDVARRQLTIDASEHELEISFSSMRHKFRNVAAAVRIYLGMLAVTPKDVFEKNESRALETLAKFEKMAIEEVSEVAGSFNASMLMTRIKRHHTIIGLSASEKALVDDGVNEPSRSPANIWMLDDQVHKYLWSLFMPEFCAGGVFRPYDNWELLKPALNYGMFAADVSLILDCNLGSDPSISTGLERLAEIRHAYPENRIIMMSAFDDAQMALTAVRAGANAYFVKQLSDPSDRGSIDYYRSFTKLFDDSTPEAARVRTLWRKFQATLPDRNEEVVCKEFGCPRTIEQQIRLAFRLAFLETENTKWLSWVGTPLDRQTSSTARMISLVLMAGWQERTGPRTWSSIADVTNGSRHMEDISLDESLTILEEVIQRLVCPGNEPVLGHPDFPSYCPYKEEHLKTDSPYPGRNCSEPLINHSKLSRRAAAELIVGVNVVRAIFHPHSGFVSGKSDRDYSDVLVIDDEGSSSGWFNALEQAFPNVVYHDWTQCPDDESIVEQLRLILSVKQYSLLIMDLKMPNAEDGLRVFDIVRRLYPTLPVIIASASIETLNAMRCIRRGAVDYVSKALPFVRTSNESMEFYLRLRATVSLARRLGKSRVCEFWNKSHELKSKKLPPKLETVWRICSDPDSNKGMREYLSDFLDEPQSYKPPSPHDWMDILVEQMSVVVKLYHDWWVLRESENLVPFRYADKKTKEDLDSSPQDAFDALPRALGDYRYRVVKLYAIDHWRDRHVMNIDQLQCTAHDEYGRYGSLVALLAGGLVDELARWYWCINNEQQLITDLWGTNNPDLKGSKISINSEIHLSSEGLKVWNLRNEVLYNNQTINFGDTERIIEETFNCIDRFVSKVGMCVLFKRLT